MTNPDFDAFARLLDGDLPDGEATAEARSLGALASMLAATAKTPEMERKAELRAMLIEAARDQATAPTALERFRSVLSPARYSGRLAAMTGAAAMALSSGGVALAAHQSTPSDGVFYSVKLTYEDVRVALISDPVAKAEALMASADRRLAEAEAAASAGDMEAAQRALAEADADSRGAAGHLIRVSQQEGDPELLELLDEFAARYRKRLAVLLPALDGPAAQAGEDAMVGLRRINQRLAVLAAPCGDCDNGRKTANTANAKGDKEAASDPDFDFAVIPPADEPFAPCPCVTDDGDTGTADAKKRDAKGKRKTATEKGSEAASTKPAASAGGGDAGEEPTGEDPGGGGGDDPGDGPGGGEDDPIDQLPDPVKDPAKDTVDDADDVIEDILDEASELPDLPLDPTDLPLIN